jgi:hypothetical protein
LVLVTDLGISHLVDLTADEARAAARALRAREILKGSQAKLCVLNLNRMGLDMIAGHPHPPGRNRQGPGGHDPSLP